jgi:hypothetical protein
MGEQPQADDLPAFNREGVQLVDELQPAKAMKAENRDELGVRA